MPQHAMDDPLPQLLAAGEPHPVVIARSAGTSPFFIAADHAGRIIPAVSGRSACRRASSSVTSPGTSASRARRVSLPTGSMPASSGRPIRGSSSTATATSPCRPRSSRSARTPTCRAIGRFLTPTGCDGRRRSSGLPPAPCRGARPAEGAWPGDGSDLDAFLHAGLQEHRPAMACRGALQSRPGLRPHRPRPARTGGDLVVGDNEPYRVGDLTDYTIPVHGERRGLPHVEMEIRQDLIAEEAGQRSWAARLARILPGSAGALRGARAGRSACVKVPGPLLLTTRKTCRNPEMWGLILQF